jgi:hypothetical protein
MLEPSPTTSTPHAHTARLRLVVLRVQASFTVHTCDRFSNKITLGGTEPAVQLLGPDCVTGHSVDHQDGTLICLIGTSILASD